MKKYDARQIFSFGGICLAVFFFSTIPVSSQNQISADESFELNIAQDQITEAVFERATSVGITNSGLNVRVGAGVGARRIVLLLNGIYGRVRFRASLEPLRRRNRMVSPDPEP